MRGNTIGQLFRLTSFGESHGTAIGGVLDGCPAGLQLDLEAVQRELDRRRPGSTPLGTARNEADRVEWLSGLFETPRDGGVGGFGETPGQARSDDLKEGMGETPGQARSDAQGKARSDDAQGARGDVRTTLGTPIGFLIRNADAKSGDYDSLKDVYRPGHADKTWEDKFGLRDHRGGGRSSARTTAAVVVAGAIARQFLSAAGIEVSAYVSAVGGVKADPAKLDLATVWDNPVRCADPDAARAMTALIEEVRAQGDSVGGVVSCSIQGTPAGLGEPVFDKLEADLAKAMLSINAAKGFQVGSGFEASALRGSEHNKRSQGGILGGISTGEAIHFDVAFKPTATIAQAQETTDRSGAKVTLEAKGRHDPCVVPRAVPIVEAMACIVLMDHLLRQRSART